MFGRHYLNARMERELIADGQKAGVQATIVKVASNGWAVLAPIESIPKRKPRRPRKRTGAKIESFTMKTYSQQPIAASIISPATVRT